MEFDVDILYHCSCRHDLPTPPDKFMLLARHVGWRVAGSDTGGRHVTGQKVTRSLRLKARIFCLRLQNAEPIPRLFSVLQRRFSAEHVRLLIPNSSNLAYKVAPPGEILKFGFSLQRMLIFGCNAFYCTCFYRTEE